MRPSTVAPRRLSHAPAATLLALAALACAGACRPRTHAPAQEPERGRAAQVAAPAAQTDPCDTVANQLALTSCRGEGARRAEAAEAERYARALGVLRQKGAASQAVALERAEQKWKDYRDATCQAAADLYAGGSVAGLILVDCRARLATARAAELRAIYPDEASR